jgi:TFIIF-interacting CTD phosphatase-like protein
MAEASSSSSVAGGGGAGSSCSVAFDVDDFDLSRRLFERYIDSVSCWAIPNSVDLEDFPAELAALDFLFNDDGSASDEKLSMVSSWDQLTNDSKVRHHHHYFFQVSAFSSSVFDVPSSLPVGFEKLSLILDLDHTLVHAAQRSALPFDLDPTLFIDESGLPELYSLALPTTASAASATSSPSALPDSGVTSSSSPLSSGGVGSFENYYVKLRPGLRRFLAALAPMFSLYVYTKATRPYLEFLSKILDPDKK